MQKRYALGEQDVPKQGMVPTTPTLAHIGEHKPLRQSLCRKITRQEKVRIVTPVFYLFIYIFIHSF